MLFRGDTMKQLDVDALSRRLAFDTTRRGAVLRLLSGVTALATLGLADGTDAKKKKKKKDRGESYTDCTVCARGCAHSTIEAAIAAANDKAVITVAPGTYQPAADPGTVALIIEKDLTLRACRANDRPIVKSRENAGVFGLSKSSNGQCVPITVEIDGFILDGDNKPSLALIAGCATTWTLKHSVVRKFKTLVHTNLSGVPINVLSSAPGLIENSTITECVSVGDPGSLISSAVYVLTPMNSSATEAPLEIKHSTITGNSGSQGAVLIMNKGKVTLSGTTQITNNTSDQTGTGVLLFATNQSPTPVYPGTLILIDEASITNNRSSAGSGAGRIYVVEGSTVEGVTEDNVKDNSPNNYCEALLSGGSSCTW